MNALVPYLLGAASALTVQLVTQLYVVPKVEMRKRREDRWERNVLELGELLTTLLGDRATKARAAQSLFEDLRHLEGDPEYRDRIPQIREDHIWKTHEATRAFTDLAHTRADWLADRIAALWPEADEIAKFWRIYRMYWLRVAVIVGWDKDDTDAKVEERWQYEYEARTELISQVKVLADLPHPPRISLHKRWWRPGIIRAHRGVRRASTDQSPNDRTAPSPGKDSGAMTTSGTASPSPPTAASS